MLGFKVPCALCLEWADKSGREDTTVADAVTMCGGTLVCREHVQAAVNMVT